MKMLNLIAVQYLSCCTHTNREAVNIADSMLQDHKNEEAYQKDAQALSLLMIRMMELSISLENSVTLRLKKPQRWKKSENVEWSIYYCIYLELVH